MALEISERERARAFVELLAQRQFSNPNNQLIIKPPTIEKLNLLPKLKTPATITVY